MEYSIVRILSQKLSKYTVDKALLESLAVEIIALFIIISSLEQHCQTEPKLIKYQNKIWT
jgi:hypothetical protein